MISKQRILLTANGKAVPQGHPEGRQLLVCQGGIIDSAVAAHYGIVDGVLPEKDATLKEDGSEKLFEGLPETGPSPEEMRQKRVVTNLRKR